MTGREPYEVRAGHCLDCGLATGGIRCRPCNGKHSALLAAQRLDASDRELLELAKTMPHTRLAVRYGVSRVRIGQKVKQARARQELLGAARVAAAFDVPVRMVG